MAGRDVQPNGRPALPGARPGARLEQVPAAQVVAATGTAIASAAKVGRLLTRTGWGLARRLPGGQAVQREVQRLQDAALTEARRVLDIPQNPSTGNSGNHPGNHAGNNEAQRVMMLIQDSAHGGDPLRGAMSELLERSVETDRTTSRDYLYGNIISQLVPDEARILAALADGSSYAAMDVVAKTMGRRSANRVVLANASTVGRSAGVALPDNTPTYITRLYRFGLIDFGPADAALNMQFDILSTESAIQAAEASIEARKLGSPKLVRKTLFLSQFGREFWAACDPSRPALPDGTA